MDSQVVHCSGYAVGFFLSCCLALAHVLPLAGVAGAQFIDEAQVAHTEGRFTDAALIGEALGTSQGFALAAKSLTIHAHFIAGDGEKEALFERAIGLARKAVSFDSGNANAHLQLARDIGRLAQVVGSFEAGYREYAEEVRAAIDNALRLDPELVSAHLSLGRWYAGVVGTAGSLLARALCGAREKDAVASFERALELAPQAIAVHLQYALGLLALDDDDYREKVRGLLERAIEIPAKDAYERLLHKSAVERLKTLDTSGR